MEDGRGGNAMAHNLLGPFKQSGLHPKKCSAWDTAGGRGPTPAAPVLGDCAWGAGCGVPPASTLLKVFKKK